MSKLRCENPRCNWVGDTTNALQAPNPFAPGEIIYGCPECRECNGTLRAACDVDGCGDFGTCGTPTTAGYRLTCFNHVPSRS